MPHFHYLSSTYVYKKCVKIKDHLSHLRFSIVIWCKFSAPVVPFLSTLCTYHDSTYVLPCAEPCSYLFIKTWIRAKYFFSYLNYARQSSMKWPLAPERYKIFSRICTKTWLALNLSRPGSSFHSYYQALPAVCCQLAFQLIDRSCILFAPSLLQWRPRIHFVRDSFLQRIIYIQSDFFIPFIRVSCHNWLWLLLEICKYMYHLNMMSVSKQLML